MSIPKDISIQYLDHWILENPYILIYMHVSRVYMYIYVCTYVRSVLCVYMCVCVIRYPLISNILVITNVQITFLLSYNADSWVIRPYWDFNHCSRIITSDDVKLCALFPYTDNIKINEYCKPLMGGKSQ